MNFASWIERIGKVFLITLGAFYIAIPTFLAIFLVKGYYDKAVEPQRIAETTSHTMRLPPLFVGSSQCSAATQRRVILKFDRVSRNVSFNVGFLTYLSGHFAAVDQSGPILKKRTSF